MRRPSRSVSWTLDMHLSLCQNCCYHGLTEVTGHLFCVFQIDFLCPSGSTYRSLARVCWLYIFYTGNFVTLAVITTTCQLFGTPHIMCINVISSFLLPPSLEVFFSPLYTFLPHTTYISFSYFKALHCCLWMILYSPSSTLVK